MNSTSTTLPSTPLPSRVVLGPAYGTFLLCTFLGLIFYGVALHQVYRYIRLHSSDRLLIKSYVALLVVLDAMHTVMAVHMNYSNLVTNFFRPDRLQRAPWSLNMEPLTTGVLIVACQSFFAGRVYKVDKRYRILVAISIVMFILELGLALAYTIKAFAIGTVDRLNDYSWMQSAGFGVVIFADIMLTFVLVLALHQRRTGFRRTNSMIDLLIAYAICTGLGTLIFAIACFITALASPANLLFGALDIVCVKVYINSVLATLNTRSSASSERAGEPPTDAIDLSVLAQSRSDVRKDWASSSGESRNANEPTTVVSIKVTNDLARRV